MDDRNLDAAIDDVARQMTAGEPDGAFRARVLARIESGSGSRGSGVGSRDSGVGSRDSGVGSRDSGVGSRDSGVGSRDSGVGRWRWAVAALGAAAMIVVALVVFRNQAPADRGARKGVESAPSAVSSAAPARSAAPEAPALQPRVVSQPRRASVRRNDAPDSASEIDALAPPPLTPFPLDVASIAVDALPPADSIQLDKLEIITPIAVAPLGEGDRQ
jgi:hypothetical protein